MADKKKTTEKKAAPKAEAPAAEAKAPARKAKRPSRPRPWRARTPACASSASRRARCGSSRTWSAARRSATRSRCSSSRRSRRREPLAKLLRSAVANAEQKGGRVDVDALFVKTLTVDQGPKMRRFMPRAMGRAYRIEKKTSHVYVELGTA